MINLKPGMELLYRASSGNTARIVVGGEGENGTLMVSWMFKATSEDMRELDAKIASECDVQVEFSGEFHSRAGAEVAQQQYLNSCKRPS